MNVGEWVAYAIPWWFWALPAGAGVAVLFIVVARTFGIRNALTAALLLAVGLASAVSRQRGRQDGWKDRQAKETRDAEETIRRANKARDSALSAPVDRLRDDDGFKRQ